MEGVTALCESGILIFIGAELVTWPFWQIPGSNVIAFTQRLTIPVRVPIHYSTMSLNWSTRTVPYGARSGRAFSKRSIIYIPLPMQPDGWTMDAVTADLGGTRPKKPAAGDGCLKWTRLPHRARQNASPRLTRLQ